MTTVSTSPTHLLDACEGLLVAGAPALGDRARVIVRTNRFDHSVECDPALAAFQRVSSACSRFDPTSELRKVNAEPRRWHVVSRALFAALREASWAYHRTSGEYDPRLHDGGAGLPWRPRLADSSSSANLDGSPLDLDDIARGLALRWAGRALQGAHHLLEVGHDAVCRGRGPDGGPWRVGVPDPFGDGSPCAVLSLSDTACATSTAPRARVGGRAGGDGLQTVTVVGPDPVAAEVWSAVLLSVGAKRIAEAATRRRLPAAWVTDDGQLHLSPTIEPKVVWRR